MVGARRTRAAGASPGGFKSLDDIPKKSTRGKGKKIKAEALEPSIESESTDPFITPAEANNNTESQKTQSPPTNASRTNSPGSQSPSPAPGDSRSTSPPPKNNTAFNGASSDNDVINHEQAAARIAPLESKKRSREDEPAIHENVDITNTEEDVEQKVSKRTRRQQSSDIEDIAAEADKSTEPELEPKNKSRGRPSNRTARFAPLESKKRSREDEPAIHESIDITNTEENVEQRASKRTRRQQSSDIEDIAVEAEKSTEPELEPKNKFRGRPGNRTKATPKKPANKTRGRKQDPIVLDDISSGLYDISSDETDYTTIPPFVIPPDVAAARGISMMDQLRITINRGTLDRGEEAAKKSVQAAIDVVHQRERQTTAVASSSEELSKPWQGSILTDPYFVAVVNVFIAQKNNSKALPSLEQVKAFLTTFDAPQPQCNPKAQTVTKEPTRPPQPKKPKRSGFCVPDTDNNNTDISDEEEAQVVDEPKTPEAQTSPSQDASPRNSFWKNPISYLADAIVSPFRNKPTAAPAPVSGNELVPPFIFNQPPTTPAAAPVKRMSHSDRKRNNRNNVQGRLAGFQTELHPSQSDVEKIPPPSKGNISLADLKEMYKMQDAYAARIGFKRGYEVNQDIHKNARASQRAAVTTPVEAETSATTNAKTGEKRDAEGAPKMPSQRRNDFLRNETEFSRKETRPDSDFGPRWIRVRNGLFIRENSTDRQFQENYIVTDDDPMWEDFYRDIDAFPKQNIYKPAGVQNPLDSGQLLQQAQLRARGVAGIPDESENDYTYVTNEQQKRLLFYPRSPYGSFFESIGKRLNADHIQNIKDGLPILTPRDEDGNAITTPSPSREQTTTNIFQQLHDWDKKHYYKDAVEMKAGRVLEQKQWSQTPPPKPQPGNAKLPETVEQTPAPIPEAVKHAMSRANKYLPAKGSGLRQVSNMSPLQAEQDRVIEAAKESKPMFNFDFSDESLGFHVDPLVKECVLERLGEGYVPITPIPDHIWREHDDLQLGEVEQAVAKLFEGIDPRLFGSMHNGIKVPKKPKRTGFCVPSDTDDTDISDEEESLAAFDAEFQFDPKTRLFTKSPTRPPQPEKPKRTGFCVPSDTDDTDMSDEEESLAAFDAIFQFDPKTRLYTLKAHTSSPTEKT